MSATIRRLLVANRAEVASRVFRTCRELGIEPVAVHSDADALLPYVREADAAVRLPGNAPAETYLRGDLMIDAARRTGADAVHPGYGFLSEDADFARAVVNAGLTWVGPSPESIFAMASKVRAKELMRAAGVPVLEAPVTPGLADLPLIVKASAGGGGRGMRIVHDLDHLAREIDAAGAEAESAFGDGTVFVEPYVERGRHVEVQVVGDQHGDILVLGERDCSLQRRHQKVVEESPAPRLPGATRAALHDAARAAAAAVDYVGAGTVEFLYDPAADRFFFLEMNTRLQVEHPVTEEVYGVDLVALQLTVAEGGSCALPRAGARSAAHDPSGHAIEVRLYAEDPATAYAPQSGTLSAFEIPDAPGLRVDAGYESGSEVSTFYDAMLAKVVVHAPTRGQAARTLAGVLARARIHGVATNRDQLVGVLRDPDFLAGRGIDRLPRGAPTGLARARRRPRRRRGPRPRRARPPRHAPSSTPSRSPGATSSANRRSPASLPGRPPRTGLQPGLGRTTRSAWSGGADATGTPSHGLLVRRAGPEGVRLERDGVATTYAVAISGDRVEVDAPAGHRALLVVPRFTDPLDDVAGGSMLAPMPGTVVSVAVEEGQRVETGDPVLVLEAMKMQHTVSAPHAGTVTRLDVRPGAQVAGRRGPRRGGGQSLATTESKETRAVTSYTESDERLALRREVAKLAGTYGREWFTERARSGEKTTELWLEIGRTATSASTSPRSTAAVVAASATSRRSARSWPPRAARCC